MFLQPEIAILLITNYILISLMAYHESCVPLCHRIFQKSYIESSVVWRLINDALEFLSFPWIMFSWMFSVCQRFVILTPLGCPWIRMGTTESECSSIKWVFRSKSQIKSAKTNSFAGINLPSLPLRAVSVTNKKPCSFISIVSNDVHVILFSFYLLLFKFKCKKRKERQNLMN